MVKRFNIFLCLFFCLYGGFPETVCVAQSVADKAVIPWDESSVVEVRRPPEQELNALRQNPEYFYDRDDREPNFWDRLLAFLYRYLFQSIGEVSAVKYFLSALVVLVFVVIIVRLLRIPVTGFFSFSAKVQGSDLTLVNDESRREDELEQMLMLYKSNGAYREAIRVLYLICLKKLDRGGLIRMRENKTNREYLYELNGDADRRFFRHIARIYEYVWYGHFEPDAEAFNSIEVDVRKRFSTDGREVQNG
ncbi:DUF4129 domain-containing protein [Geofilum sp. OHC36d9]|uniref:DUF4129 domain-containing protein n=1 Tax=Geofilum sp. OHC36d9 TaxID=3458413 RepID=UPI0040337560